MQLEKVTSRSSEASVVGWISSNDATLFTTVLVVVIAIFLHGKLSQGARENAALKGRQASFDQDLESVASELHSAQDLLDKKTQQLDLTQKERDQLQLQLSEQLERISQLIAKLDAAILEKGRLETERESLAKATESLAKEKTDLTAERAALATERSSLQTDNTTLRERLDELSRQLADKLAAMDETEKQRDRMKRQADELEGIVANLRRELGELNLDLTATRERAAVAQAASESKVQDLEAQLAAGGKKAEDYLAQLKRSMELLQSVKIEKEQLQGALTLAERQRQSELIEEVRHNRELVGLKGQIERVAILFDASGSMQHPASGSDQNRWAEAQDIAATWLENLKIQKCVLIVFASDVRTFPEDGTMADLSGESGTANRESLMQRLKTVTPEGWTNTHDAMRKAYEYDIDSILLFSDGAPSKPDSNVFDPATAEKIYALCRQHPNIPVNTIGLGNYFEKNMSTFLRSVASISGGTFRGK